MDTFSDYDSFDGLGLASLVQQDIVTAEELLNTAINRIEKINPHLNAVIHKMYDEARSSVRQLTSGGLFQGVPFLLKDLLAEYSGVPMHCGSRVMNNYISPRDSEIVNRFKSAGLITVGKTNTPEFGLNPITEPELFGPTLNPWDVTKTCGGSSGGSAVAVATGMVPIAHGGDGAGSLRIPAAYCGVFGLKPSRGRTPTGPLAVRIWQGMVTEHVITRSVRDSAAILDVLSGVELGSPICLAKPQESFLECLNHPLEKLKIAVSDQPFFSSKVDPEYKNYLKIAGELCASLGHKVETATFSIDIKDVTLAFIIEVSAETAAAMKMLATTLSQKVDYNLLEVSNAVLCSIGETFTAADFAWASYILDQVGREAAEFGQKYDVLVTPTMPIPPPNLGSLQPDRFEKNILEVLRHFPYHPLLRKLTEKMSGKYFEFIPFTPIYNITGQPAMSVPLFWDTKGLPVGIQFAGRFGEEKILFKLARQLEEAKPWAHMRPSAI